MMVDMVYKNRFQHSCNTCRTKKIKCDRGQPSCSHCIKRSLNCVYASNSRKSNQKNLYDSAPGQLHLFQYVNKQANTLTKKDNVGKTSRFSVKKPLPSPELQTSPPPQLISSESDSDTNSCIFPLSNQYMYNPNFLTPEHSENGSSPFPFALNETEFPFFLEPLVPKSNLETYVSEFDVNWLKQLKITFPKSFSKGKYYELVNEDVISSHSLKCQKEDGSCHSGLINSVGCDYVAHYNPLTSSELITSGNVKSLELHLINLYFSIVNLFNPLVHQETFYKKLAMGYPHVSESLVYAICYRAAGYINLNPFYSVACPYRLAAEYQAKALPLIYKDCENPTLETLQSIILIHNGNCNLSEHLIGLQFKILKHLGIHALTEKTLNEQYPTDAQKEEILNCWTLLFSLDKLCALTRGLPYHFPISNIDLVMNFFSNKYKFGDKYSQYQQTRSYSQLASLSLFEIADMLARMETSLKYLPTDINTLYNYTNECDAQLESVFNRLMDNMPQDPSEPLIAVTLILFRSYYHLASIHMYSSIGKISMQYPELAAYLTKKCIASASSIAFGFQCFPHEVLAYGPLLKINSLVMSYTVFQMIESIGVMEYNHLAEIGKLTVLKAHQKFVAILFGFVITLEQCDGAVNEFIKETRLFKMPNSQLLV
jgi:hypothetical protein